METNEAKPAFARFFPRDAELDALVAAFARGDYAGVGRGARELASRTTDGAVRDAARTLLARTEADPLAKLLFALALAILVTLSTYWITR